MLYVVGAVYFLGHLSTISCEKWKNFLRYYDTRTPADLSELLRRNI